MPEKAGYGNGMYMVARAYSMGSTANIAYVSFMMVSAWHDSPKKRPIRSGPFNDIGNIAGMEDIDCNVTGTYLNRPLSCFERKIWS